MAAPAHSAQWCSTTPAAIRMPCYGGTHGHECRRPAWRLIQKARSRHSPSHDGRRRVAQRQVKHHRNAHLSTEEPEHQRRGDEHIGCAGDVRFLVALEQRRHQAEIKPVERADTEPGEVEEQRADSQDHQCDYELAMGREDSGDWNAGTGHDVEQPPPDLSAGQPYLLSQSKHAAHPRKLPARRFAATRARPPGKLRRGPAG